MTQKFMSQRLQQLLLAFFMLFGVTAVASAQVTISMPSINGSVGQTVSIPVNLANVPNSGFNSFQFDITPSSDALIYKGAFRTATLANTSGWSFLNNYVANGNAKNRVLGFSSSNDKISTSGILVFLQFEIVSVEAGVTVQLTELSLKLGADALSFTPAVPSTGLNASNSPVATDDAYQLQEGATLTVPAGTGVLANDTDQDADPLTATVGTTTANGTLTLAADGSFTYVHNGSETTTDSFTY